MRQTAHESQIRSLGGRPEPSMAVYIAGEPLAWPRRTARDFLARARDARVVAVSERVTDTVRPVVSELVTNARRYAPGLCLPELTITDGVVEIGVRDGEPTLAVAHAPTRSAPAATAWRPCLPSACASRPCTAQFNGPRHPAHEGEPPTTAPVPSRTSA